MDSPHSYNCEEFRVIVHEDKSDTSLGFWRIVIDQEELQIIKSFDIVWYQFRINEDLWVIENLRVIEVHYILR